MNKDIYIVPSILRYTSAHKNVTWLMHIYGVLLVLTDNIMSFAWLFYEMPIILSPS